MNSRAPDLGFSVIAIDHLWVFLTYALFSCWSFWQMHKWELTLKTLQTAHICLEFCIIESRNHQIELKLSNSSNLNSVLKQIMLDHFFHKVTLRVFGKMDAGKIMIFDIYRSHYYFISKFILAPLLVCLSICLSCANFVIDFQLTSRWARNVQFLT